MDKINEVNAVIGRQGGFYDKLKDLIRSEYIDYYLGIPDHVLTGHVCDSIVSLYSSLAQIKTDKGE